MRWVAVSTYDVAVEHEEAGCGGGRENLVLPHAIVHVHDPAAPRPPRIGRGRPCHAASRRRAQPGGIR